MPVGLIEGDVLLDGKHFPGCPLLRFFLVGRASGNDQHVFAAYFRPVRFFRGFFERRPLDCLEFLCQFPAESDLPVAERFVQEFQGLFQAVRRFVEDRCPRLICKGRKDFLLFLFVAGAGNLRTRTCARPCRRA